MFAEISRSSVSSPYILRFREVIRRYDNHFTDFELLKRFDLYERANNAFAVVVASEADGNIVLKKGPVMM
ncbi:MAG: RbsD/FucU domain-containing protein [Spirochaetia bacterium]